MNFFKYISESFGELKHIKWTTRKETIIYTVSVVVIAVAVAYYIGLLDMIFTMGLEKII